MPNDLPGAERPQSVDVVPLDPFAAVTIGDGVHHAQEPRKGIRESTVEIEDHQPIGHSRTSPCVRQAGAYTTPSRLASSPSLVVERGPPLIAKGHDACFRTVLNAPHAHAATGLPQ